MPPLDGAVDTNAAAALDTTIYHLSQPLVKSLLERNSAVPLDPLSSQCLVDLKTLIEKVLLDSFELSQESKPIRNKSMASAIATLKRSPTSGVGRSFRAKKVAPEQKRESNASTLSRRDNTIFHTQESIPDNIVQLQRRAKGQRLRKQRALVAVFPYTEVAEQEGSKTLMMTLFGASFARWWFKWKAIHAVLFFVFFIVLEACTFIYLLKHNVWRDSFWIRVAHGLSLMETTLCLSSVQGAHLVRRCLSTYEGLWIFLETFACGLSVWAVACFRWQDIGVPVSIVLMIGLPYALYDSYPISIRLKLRLSLLLGFGFISFFMVLFYIKSFKEYMCFYRLDLEHGLVDEADIAKGFFQLSPWNLSIFDFCANRWLTLLTLMFRIVYSSYKHPTDCIILKSRVRLIETAVTEAHQSSRRTISSATSTTPVS